MCVCVRACVCGLHVKAGACLRVKLMYVITFVYMSCGNGSHNNTNSISLTRQVTFCFGCGD